MLYLDTEKCKKHRFLVAKVEDKCTDKVMSAVSRARLYTQTKLDTVSRGPPRAHTCQVSRVSGHCPPIGSYLPSHLCEWPLRADRPMLAIVIPKNPISCAAVYARGAAL